VGKKSVSHISKNIASTIITLGAGIVLSVLTFILVQRLEFKDLRSKFNYDTENYSVALEKSIEENLNSLHAVRGLFTSTPQVTRAMFHTFANNLLPHSKGIHALRWVPRVPDAARKKYETAAIKDGYSQYRFTELNSQKQPVTAGKRDEYFPVYFTESTARNDATLGLDMSAHPAGRASLEKARDTGDIVVTRRIKLFLEADPQFAFLAMQPIYHNALPSNTLEERRKNLTGFAMGVFRFGDMVNAALKGINLEGIELSLFDESATPDRKLLYSNLSQTNLANDVLSFTKTLKIADRRWAVKFQATPEYLSTHRTRYSWAVLAGGLIFTCLITLYIAKMKRHTSEMEQSRDTLTTVLNSINAAIAIVDAKDMTISACNKVFIKGTEVNENGVLSGRCNDIAQKRQLPCNQVCDECAVTWTMRTGEDSTRESIHCGANGSVKYMDIRAYPVKDDCGNVLHVVHIAQDITERKQAENSRLEEQQIRRMSAERQVVETQLRMLQAQIEPHFLFNTLANIISLIDSEPISAKNMLQHLTRSLRLSLERAREDVSTLEQEVDMLRDYLSIFKMRLGQRLDFTITIPGELFNVPFPPMLLQPLVENAIKHGIEPKVEGGRVTITAEKSDSLLRISVSDTGLGFSNPMNAHGLGLENVKARLKALYNFSASLVLEENIPCGATATIEVPL
jgi:PAS domain S-box-containing protein